jgi:hypothetical protein
MKTFRVLLKSHPDPKGVEIVGSRIEFKSFHGFLKISGGQGEAYFALTDVAAVIDEAALLAAGGGEIDIPPGSTGGDTTLSVPPGATGSDTTVSVPPGSIGSISATSKRKRVAAKVPRV